MHAWPKGIYKRRNFKFKELHNKSLNSTDLDKNAKSLVLIFILTLIFSTMYSMKCLKFSNVKSWQL